MTNSPLLWFGSGDVGGDFGAPDGVTASGEPGFAVDEEFAGFGVDGVGGGSVVDAEHDHAAMMHVGIKPGGADGFTIHRKGAAEEEDAERSHLPTGRRILWDGFGGVHGFM